MRKLSTVLAERDQAKAALDANLAAAKAEDRQLNEDEKKKHQELMGQLKALNDEAEEIREYEAEVARTASIIYRQEEPATPSGQNGHVSVNQNRAPGEVTARMIRCIAAGKNLHVSPVQYAEDTFKDPEVAKALAAGQGADGGFLVPEQYSTEIIGLLRNRVAVRALGARIVPVPMGSLTMPKMATSAMGGYIGENEDLSTSQPTFGGVKFTARKMGCIVPVSNELLRFSSPAADGLVRDDLIQSLALTEDINFLRGTGTGNGPKGLRNWADPVGVIPANGSVNLANVGTDLGKLERALMEANIPMGNCGYIMAPRAATYLKELRDGNGNKAYPEMSNSSPTLRGYAVRVTNQVPINLGGGGNESELYFADFDQVMIGETMGINLHTSSEASYHDGVQLQSAFSKDQTVVRAITMHDFVVRHDRAVAVLTALTWGN